MEQKQNQVSPENNTIPFTISYPSGVTTRKPNWQYQRETLFYISKIQKHIFYDKLEIFVIKLETFFLCWCYIMFFDSTREITLRSIRPIVPLPISCTIWSFLLPCTPCTVQSAKTLEGTLLRACPKLNSHQDIFTALGKRT